eukprot:4201365-Pleurochrysis_carterae.AAC.3
MTAVARGIRHGHMQRLGIAAARRPRRLFVGAAMVCYRDLLFEARDGSQLIFVSVQFIIAQKTDL